MLNAKGVEQARFRTIRIRAPDGEKEVQGELVKNFDPMERILIYKYGTKKEQRVCLVEERTGKVLFQNATYIWQVKGAIAPYRDNFGKYGLLNARGQVILEAGVLKNFKVGIGRRNKK